MNLSYPGPESISRHTLENGIILLVYENFSSQTVVIDGVLHTGAINDPPEKAGLASFTSDLLMRGTMRRSFEAIYDELEAVGAGLSFWSGRLTTQFAARGLAEDIDLLLSLAADSLREPTFPEQQVEQVRGQIMTGMQMRANDTRYMASRRFAELAYEGHPYQQSVSGYLTTLPAISRDDVVAFHEASYGPQGMIVTVVGAVDVNTAVAKVGNALGDWVLPNQLAIPDIPDAGRPTNMVREHWPMRDKRQADIVMGLPGPRRSAEDYLDASLMNTVLGVFGSMGRIGNSVREKQGLAYYASSRLAGGKGPGSWTASAGVAPDKVEQATASILDEIRRIQDELVPEEELRDSKAYRTGSLPVGLETNGALANIIGDMEYMELGLDYLQRYDDLIAAITPERVQAAAQKYLSTEELIVSVAGPPEV